MKKKLMNKFKIFTFQSDSSKGIIKVVKKALKDNDSLLELKLSKIDMDMYELRTITDATTLKKSSKLTSDEQKYIDLLKANDEKAELLSYKYKDNKRVILTAIRECNVGFSFVFEKLRKDREVVISAIRKNSEDFQYLSKKFRSDKEILMIAISKNYPVWILDFADKKLFSDKEVVMMAVKNTKGALKYASKELRSDKEVVMTAVSKNGVELQYASLEVRADREVVALAIANYSYALMYASKELQIMLGKKGQ